MIDSMRTSRDETILEALTLKVRIVTLSQVAETWWGGATALARRRLGYLESLGLVARHRVNLHPMLQLSGPVCVWEQREQKPDAGAVAYRLQSRWAKPLILSTVYVATQKAGDQFGGFGGGFKHRTQLTHDVHLSELYLKRVRTGQADDWVGEEVFAAEREGEKLPDAILRDGSGQIYRVIEFGGRYDSRRVSDFHDDCAGRGLPYEIW